MSAAVDSHAVYRLIEVKGMDYSVIILDKLYTLVMANVMPVGQSESFGKLILCGGGRGDKDFFGYFERISLICVK